MSATPCKLGHTDRYSSGVCKECSRDRSRDYYRRNRERISAYNAKWGRSKKEHIYHYYLKRTYGITPQQYDTMFAAQGGQCAICRTGEPGSKLGRWHVDHCHATGIVRGILCAQCNVMIAMAREDGRILEAGIRYLAEDADAAH